MTINYSVTTLAWVIFLVIWLVVARRARGTAHGGLGRPGGPLPSRLKTLWASVDYLVFRSSPDYASADPADRAPGNGGRY